MSSNKSNGTSKERELCLMLTKWGFWAHRLVDRINGQPFDVVAVRNGIAVALDSKICNNGVFLFSRVEPNQEAAMKLWKERASSFVGFAIYDGVVEEWRYLPYDKYIEMKGECYRQVHVSELCRLENVYGKSACDRL